MLQLILTRAILFLLRGWIELEGPASTTLCIFTRTLNFLKLKSNKLFQENFFQLLRSHTGPSLRHKTIMTMIVCKDLVILASENFWADLITTFSFEIEGKNYLWEYHCYLIISKIIFN